MSTETQTRTTSTGSESMAVWIVALLGLWVLVTPFFLGPTTGQGWWDFSGNWLYWSNIVTGAVIAAVAGYAGYSGSS